MTRRVFLPSPESILAHGGFSRQEKPGVGTGNEKYGYAGMTPDYRSYLLVASGGFCGAVLRWFIDQQVPSLAGTLVVNVIGCFFLGVFMYESIYIGAYSRETRIFFGAGVIGAFTTFSALAVQSFEAGPVFGLANLAANLVLGLVAVWIGRYFITYNRWT